MGGKNEQKVLFVIEYGVYPELIRELQSASVDLRVEHQMRKAISWLKRNRPNVVIAEFFHEPAFRDRVSNLESMLAHLQRKLPSTGKIVIYNREDEAYLQQVMERFPVDRVMTNPVAPEALLQAVTQLSSEEST